MVRVRRLSEAKLGELGAVCSDVDIDRGALGKCAVGDQPSKRRVAPVELGAPDTSNSRTGEIAERAPGEIG